VLTAHLLRQLVEGNVCRQSCELGCKCIVSKRLGSTYRSCRSRHWLKVKNPAAPAVRREAETGNTPWPAGCGGDDAMIAVPLDDEIRDGRHVLTVRVYYADTDFTDA
jgi:hypothetical protein